MKIEVTTSIDVLPILVKDSSKENFLRIKKIVSNHERGLTIHTHDIVAAGMIIMLHGHIGNMLDSLIIDLSNVDSKDDEYAYFHLARAKKCARTISENEYNELMGNGSERFYSDWC